MYTKTQWKGQCKLMKNTISWLLMHSKLQQIDYFLSFHGCYFKEENENIPWGIFKMLLLYIYVLYTFPQISARCLLMQ